MTGKRLFVNRKLALPSEILAGPVEPLEGVGGSEVCDIEHVCRGGIGEQREPVEEVRGGLGGIRLAGDAGQGEYRLAIGKMRRCADGGVG